MNWKDYFYFQKRDRTAIILLLILIVISAGTYIATKQYTHDQKSEHISIKSNESIEFSPKKNDEKETVEYKEKNNQLSKYPYQEKLSKGETIELNTADTSNLKKIPGIGTGYANRIVKYRNLLGGYEHIKQLKEVWGVDEDLYNKITPYITIKPKTKPININLESFERMNKHPYISYKQAKVIIDIRERKGKIESIDRLSLLDEFTENDLNRLKVYLSFE